MYYHGCAGSGILHYVCLIMFFDVWAIVDVFQLEDTYSIVLMYISSWECVVWWVTSVLGKVCELFFDGGIMG
jgi:hypothetical protein